jgi:hypothetical protein
MKNEEFQVIIFYMEIIKNSRGASLIMILVGFAILGGALMFLSGGITQQQKENRTLFEKAGVLDFQRTLEAALDNGKVCTYILRTTNLRFDSTKLPQTLVPTLPIFAGITSGESEIPGPVLAEIGKPISPFRPYLVVSDIQLDILSGANKRYRAQWVISIDPKHTSRQLKPVIMKTVLVVDDSDPTEATIESCLGTNISSLASEPCPPGQVFTGYDESGFILCRPNHLSCPAGELYSGVDSLGKAVCVRDIRPGNCSSGRYITEISHDKTPTCLEMSNDPTI